MFSVRFFTGCFFSDRKPSLPLRSLQADKSDTDNGIGERWVVGMGGSEGRRGNGFVFPIVTITVVVGQKQLCAWKIKC